MEKPSETIQENVLCVGKHIIELKAEKDSTPLTQEHIHLASVVIEKFSKTFGEKLLTQYDSIVSRNDPQRTFAKRFPMNGENLYSTDAKNFSVVIYNRGMDTTLAHRVSTQEKFVDNFSGTVLHEIAHGGSFVRLFENISYNRQFIMEWKKEFGWKSIFANIRNPTTWEWEKSPIPADGWEKDSEGYWHKGGYVITDEEYTDLPELCIGGSKGYAASIGPQEDICDSVTAYLLNPTVLDSRKTRFIEKWLAEK